MSPFSSWPSLIQSINLLLGLPHLLFPLIYTRLFVTCSSSVCYMYTCNPNWFSIPTLFSCLASLPVKPAQKSSGRSVLLRKPKVKRPSHHIKVRLKVLLRNFEYKLCLMGFFINISYILRSRGLFLIFGLAVIELVTCYPHYILFREIYLLFCFVSSGRMTFTCLPWCVHWYVNLCCCVILLCSIYTSLVFIFLCRIFLLKVLIAIRVDY